MQCSAVQCSDAIGQPNAASSTPSPLPKPSSLPSPSPPRRDPCHDLIPGLPACLPGAPACLPAWRTCNILGALSLACSKLGRLGGGPCGAKGAWVGRLSVKQPRGEQKGPDPGGSHITQGGAEGARPRGSRRGRPGGSRKGPTQGGAEGARPWGEQRGPALGEQRGPALGGAEGARPWGEGRPGSCNSYNINSC